MQRRFFSWVTLVAVGLAGVVAVSAATVRAAPTAQPTASAFELIVDAEIAPDWLTSEGTFRSRAPFCASGRSFEFVEDRLDTWRFTCDDGTGSLTVAVRQDSFATWWIKGGSGSYADLRGRGSSRLELLGEGTFRSTFQGVVDWRAEPEQPEDGDTVAPSIAFTSASPTKLRRPAGAYSIRVAFSLRDDVEGNTVAYRLRVTQTRLHRLVELASKEGTTASGSASTTLRVVPGKRVRSVKLLLSGSDLNGNEVSITRSLNLPRS